MARIIPVLLWLVLALASAGCTGPANLDLVRVLTDGRDGWQHPERVVAALDLRPGDRVAEIGAGSGYWLPYLSEAVGPEGRVYAVEVEADLATDLETLVADEGYENVEVIFAAYDDPKLPNASIDLAITCLTYHHIDERVAYFRALHADLSPRGRVAHLDDRPDAPAPISWPMGQRHI